MELHYMAFFKGIEINENSARKIVTNYYDILRSILEAIASIDGYKVYSHEAFTYYLKEKNEEVISIKFDRLRKIRNGINYYGNSISVGEAKEIVDDIKRIIFLCPKLKPHSLEWGRSLLLLISEHPKNKCPCKPHLLRCGGTLFF